MTFASVRIVRNPLAGIRSAAIGVKVVGYLRNVSEAVVLPERNIRMAEASRRGVPTLEDFVATAAYPRTSALTYTSVNFIIDILAARPVDESDKT